MEMKSMISWVEIPAKYFERAVDFYGSVLNTEFQVFDYGKEKMACFPTGEGAISYAPGFLPSENGVLVSFDTGDDLDFALQKVAEFGCRIVNPKTKIQAEGRGYFATFIDPEGNRIGLYGNQ
jgi:predicted enzyme related to lactoylglutathione lyase